MGIDLFILLLDMAAQTGIDTPLIRPSPEKEQILTFPLALTGQLMTTDTGQFSILQREPIGDLYPPLFRWNDTNRMIIRPGPLVVMTTLADLNGTLPGLQVNFLISWPWLLLVAQEAEGTGLVRINGFRKSAERVVSRSQQEWIFPFTRHLMGNMTAQATDLILKERQRE
jgi:hypothetical protein